MGSSSGRSMLRGIETRPGILRGVGVSVALFLLACIGCTEVVTTGRIFAPMRAWLARVAPPFGRLVACPMCLGWWVGLGLFLLGVVPIVAPRRVAWFVAACASSGVCWSWHVMLVRLGSREL